MTTNEAKSMDIDKLVEVQKYFQTSCNIIGLIYLITIHIIMSKNRLFGKELYVGDGVA